MQVIEEARVEGTSQESLNGRVAATCCYDVSSGRYIVEGLSASAIAIKPENLVLPIGTRVTVHGVQSRPQINGTAAKIVSSDGEIDLPCQGSLTLDACTRPLHSQQPGPTDRTLHAEAPHAARGSTARCRWKQSVSAH